MPLSGWDCPVCHDHKAPLDHYAKSSCGESIPADYVGAILKGRSERYSKGEVTVTVGLGCVRQRAIEAAEPTFPDPLSMNSMLTGTAWHSLMEYGSVDPTNTEVEVAGVIDGLPMRGKVDRLLPPDAIADHKHQKDSARKYLKGAKPEHAAQLAIYAELVQQSKGWRPTRGIIWYHDAAAGFAPMVVDPLPTLDAALTYRPFGGEFMVRELYQQAAEFYAGRKKWEDLPMAGESMRFGVQSMCNFCPVRDACFIQNRMAPF